ncbi:hypothetical protein TNCT_388521 [Trichonephila clavata]|uniref:Uncharacterized protein n=1 Tax=Trichonephila clavata TaxID=2740835 RepID=A0A8X6FDT5_TRICU|nr:hypothetical protein TNCT_388521 [Trichonephila clavata]
MLSSKPEHQEHKAHAILVDFTETVECSQSERVRKFFSSPFRAASLGRHGTLSPLNRQGKTLRLGCMGEELQKSESRLHSKP